MGARRVFARGRKSKAICERSGFKYNYREMTREPGTGYLVHVSENDGSNSLVNHPQNHPARIVEAIALRWSRPEAAVSVNTSVSADVGAR